jgi:hypothetical protein
MALQWGCGDDSTPLPSDASADHSLDQTSGQVGDACAFDGSLTTLNLPDAAIGDGGSTVPGCFGCILANCGTVVATCSADCACAEGVRTFVACVAAGNDPTLVCGLALVSVDTNSAALAACVAGSTFGGSGMGCLSACGQGSLFSEAGADAEPEAGADSPAGPPADSAVDAGSVESGPPDAGATDGTADAVPE